MSRSRRRKKARGIDAWDPCLSYKLSVRSLAKKQMQKGHYELLPERYRHASSWEIYYY